MTETRLHVAFCHPDLGLGGAERLIVDAAVEVAEQGHIVHVYTAYHDVHRCFPETVSGAFPVIQAGNWFPRSFNNCLHAFCAYVRCTLAAIWLAWQHKQYDVIIVDQVSIVIPVLQLLTRSKVLFYCHFPDLLLAQRRSRAHSAYRAPLDYAEQATTGMADRLLVNSHYTQGIFAQTFTRLHARGVVPQVLYPAVQLPSDEGLRALCAHWQSEDSVELGSFMRSGPLFVSINRFERKKGLPLAVKALHELKRQGHTGASLARLVVAGGYDKRLAENREHLKEVQQLVTDLHMEDEVYLLPSFTDGQRAALLTACVGVLYTPQHEHFGIVPLEAMASGRPVIACNSGGPTESVLPGVTGFLCGPSPSQFADAMGKLLDHDLANRMGGAARVHVKQNFSRQVFGQQLLGILANMTSATA
ncbi:MAG: hypothetical protein FRX49_06253 [Trebouxia sp. A1-2]|nr:MAG: hypothetical protein FRX49_06253 [Trebouxia sp. A1-2]